MLLSEYKSPSYNYQPVYHLFKRHIPDLNHRYPGAYPERQDHRGELCLDGHGDLAGGRGVLSGDLYDPLKDRADRGEEGVLWQTVRFQ